MTSQEHKVVRAEIATRVFVVFVAALLALTAYGVYLIRHQQVANLTTLQSAQSAARDAQRTAQLIASCTTPGEKCFDRAQRRTGEAVANINRVVIIASACAVGKTGTVTEIQSQIQACVIDQLAAVTSKGTP